jgi:hypothetical protein
VANFRWKKEGKKKEGAPRHPITLARLSDAKDRGRANALISFFLLSFNGINGTTWPSSPD